MTTITFSQVDIVRLATTESALVKSEVIRIVKSYGVPCEEHFQNEKNLISGVAFFWYRIRNVIIFNTLKNLIPVIIYALVFCVFKHFNIGNIQNKQTLIRFFLYEIPIFYIGFILISFFKERSLARKKEKFFADLLSTY